MPFIKQTITTSSAVVNVPRGSANSHIVAKNADSTNTITLGIGTRDNSGAGTITPTLTTTSANGFDLKPGEQLYFTVSSFESLWAISSAGSPVLNIFWANE